ncbi:hypothetical protein KJ840_03170 [Patescibacteria group bacterium]|nr:hypothetical protein [Patescibacteria group bacterium]
MKKHRKKILLASLVSIILITAGVLYFSVINTEEIYASGTGGDGPACFNMLDCQPPQWYPDGTGICGFGYGFAGCTEPGQCSGCGSYLEIFPFQYEVQRQCFVNQSLVGVCQMQYKVTPQSGWSPWYNCHQCYDTIDPPSTPTSCEISENDYNYALEIEDSGGNTVFAFTDAGQIMTEMSVLGVVSEVFEMIDPYFIFAQGNGDTFPIYNQDDVLIAFIGNVVGYYALYLRGILYNYQNEILSPPPTGNFIIENSFGDVVSYIDNEGKLYMVGCVSELFHFQL